MGSQQRLYSYFISDFCDSWFELVGVRKSSQNTIGEPHYGNDIFCWEGKTTLYFVVKGGTEIFCLHNIIIGQTHVKSAFQKAGIYTKYH
jgi:hypothetical protein